MEDFWLAILKRLEDPLIILVFAVIVGLFYLLLKKEKIVEEMQVCINTNIKENTAATARLVAMIEGMVYGRRDGAL